MARSTHDVPASRTASSWVRLLCGRLHLWVGLAAGVLLIPIGLTGSVLVFHDALEAALHPELLRVAPAGAAAPVDAVVARVRAAFPDTPVTRVELPAEPGETYEVALADDRTVFVDPYRASILGVHGPTDTLPGVLFTLHVNLFAGAVGKQIVGWTGLVLLVLSVTGVVIWWRGRRHVRRGLSVRWRASARRVNYDLHGAVGIWTLVPLAAVAFTGAGLVFYGAFSRTAHTVTGTPPPPVHASTPPPDVSAPARPPSLDDLLARAAAAVPGARLARLDVPITPTAPYRVRLRAPGEWHPIGLSMVFFDRYTGALLHAENALDAPAARRFGYVFYPIHIGSFGGWGVRMVYALLGLTPALLAATGAVIWYLRRRKRGRPRAVAGADERVVRAARPRGPSEAAHVRR